MQLNEDIADSKYKINAYGAGFIRINDTTYSNSLVISQDFFYENWPPVSLETLQAADIQLLLAQEPALVILGAGNKLVHPPGAILQYFYERKIGVEIMDTPAACRTMSILLAEKRNVIAGLIL